ncbi:glyoxalase/bleomycin resistance protein/dioxygenase superfamily protein [Homoserinimonas aerilata]|uniref:Glyoxalase/bleomycin resistance protein/dioxygenase superfamily protein n=1 Tax=Homoserinimonas aerilata TaxID=1162970 RepID=A0A542YJX8_9MICO|nr:VOC family protein [Homoserinimonas aerilata]TQL48408.1 glyoxalase/bleomycin resistance protein/dioxygenase superfamily protein [Homoserinimonas aerilata]
MTDRLITHLRYLALAMPNLDTELEFFTKYWGLTQVDRVDDTVYLAAEGSPEQFIVRLRKAEKRIDVIAFGAANRDDVHALHDSLAAKGVQIVHEPRELTQPGGGYGFRFFDLDGRTIEISSDVAVRAHRRIESREPIPVRLSHVVVNSANASALREWYEEHLGFALSDVLFSQKMGDLMYFMRCNEHHHSFAIAQGPHNSLHHASFEMRGIEEWMRGTGKILRSGARMVWGPGRHNAGDNTFAYFIDPAGNTLEYTTELAIIQDEDNWHPSRLDVDLTTTQDQWGTANEMNEYVARESFNDIDKGMFVAPPV